MYIAIVVIEVEKKVDLKYKKPSDDSEHRGMPNNEPTIQRNLANPFKKVWTTVR